MGPMRPMGPSLFKCKNSGFRQEWQIIGEFVCGLIEKVYFCLGKPRKPRKPRKSQEA